MRDASLASAATVAIVVHGVGDHTSGRILQKAIEGLQGFAGNIANEEVILPHLPELESVFGPATGLEIKADQKIHIIVPVVWSRLRQRAANEADFGQAYPGPASRVYKRLLDPIFYLIPAFINGIRSIPAASGAMRRILVGIIALIYAIIAPVFLFSGFLFVCYLATYRVTLDKTNFVWWRVLILLLFCWLLDWLAGKVSIVLDFVGDVVGYVGSKKHRRKAEERLLRIIRATADAAPEAQILVIGHSLGSVLVTQAILQLKKTEEFTRRQLVILTMGSPLKSMSWFFPSRILSPERLLVEFRNRNLVSFWANMWRDADVVGRALGITDGQQPEDAVKKFGETSLGDGTHPDYWADPRCWKAVVNYLDAVANETVSDLGFEWTVTAHSTLTAEEKEELSLILAKRTNIVFLSCGVVVLTFLYLDHVWHWSSWLAEFGGFVRVAVGVLSGVVGFVLVAKYLLLTQTVSLPGSTRRVILHDILREPSEVPGVTQRKLLARNRIGYFIEQSCFRLVCAVGLAAVLVFVLWKGFTV